MKKIISLIIALTILFTATSVSLAASSKNMYVTEPVYMRTGAGIQFTIITELQTGERVQWLKKSGNWAKISYNGQAGYVFSKYLSNDRIVEGTLLAAKKNVSVRSGSGTRYKKLGQIKKGETVSAISVSGSWLKINWNGIVAFVSKSYFDIMSQPGPTLDQQKEVSQYFERNKDIYLGEFIGNDGHLYYRISSGADKVKVENDIKEILNGKSFYRVIQSTRPAYVNEAYINKILQEIRGRFSSLSEDQKKLCPVDGSYYDVVEDVIGIGIIDLTDAKIELFRKWISDWPYIKFFSESGYDVPL